MPLLVLCGPPLTGKSTLASKLQKLFVNDGTFSSVSILSDDEFFATHSRTSVYRKSHHEKDLRSWLRSSVARLLSTNSLLIVDSLNDVKGFRYELHCTSKALKTPQCTVFVAGTQSHAADRNVDDRYDEQILTQLYYRFEAPDSNCRWDRPLFVVSADSAIPFDEIKCSLLNRRLPPPNQSTQTQPLSSSDYLFEVDRLTKAIAARIVDEQQFSNVVVVDGQDLVLGRKVNAPELARLRRQFVSYAKCRSECDNTSKIRALFVDFLRSSLS